MILCFWARKKNSAILPMILSYIHVHWTIKKHIENYQSTHIFFQTGFELIVWLLILVKRQIRLLGSSINDSNITFMVENKPIKSTNKVKLLGNAIDFWEMPLTTKLINYVIQQVTIWELRQEYENFYPKSKNVFLRFICRLTNTVL